MRTVRFLSICLLLLLAFTSFAWSEIALNQELTFSVPGLTNRIRQIKFNDVDGDGLPEALVCDGTNLVLYSIATGEILFAGVHSQANQLLELADVNRDGVVDIVVGGSDTPTASLNVYRVISYDGASGYSLVDSITMNTQEYYLAYRPPFGMTSIQATDINDDGLNEMLVCYETPYFSGAYIDEAIGGTSLLYYSFPDSLHWTQPTLLGQFYPYGVFGDDRLFLTTRYTYSAWDYLPYSGERTAIEPVWVNADGAISGIPGPSTTNVTLPDSHDDSYSNEQLRCMGSIGGSSLYPDFITDKRWSYSYSDFDYSYSYSGSSESLYSFDSVRAASRTWSRESLGYATYVYEPRFPGFYFACHKDSLMQFNGVDGSIYQSFRPLPSGVKSWVNPYGDERVRMIAIDSATVSLFRLDITTGIDDNPLGALPHEFALHQPYPNPFNPELSLSLSIPVNGQLKVEVFNLLGQRVASLYDGPASVGELDLTWNANEYSSGIYLIRAQYGDKIATKKAVLLK